MSDYPFADVELNRVTARVLAVLPAAGAWDATPLELQFAPFQFVTLCMRYTEGEQAADGAVLDVQLSSSDQEVRGRIVAVLDVLLTT